MLNLRRVSSIGMAAILLFVLGCQTPDLPDTVSTARDVTNTDQLTATPWGLKPSKNVHLVEQGTHLQAKDGHLYKMQTSTGEVLEDYGEWRNATTKTSAGRTSSLYPAPAGNPSNLIDYSYWINPNTQTPINHFGTNYIVPNNPSANGQTLYIGSGLSATNNGFVSPSLQWGAGPDGGGQYWSIACWYSDPGEHYYFQSTPITVSAGTSLQSVIDLTGIWQMPGYPSSYNYTLSFVGYNNSLTISNLSTPQEVIADEHLQAYDTNYPNSIPLNSSDYPPDLLVAMTGIEITTTSGQAPLTWTGVNQVTNNGQHTVVVSNNTPGGEVDLYFRCPYTPSTTLTFTYQSGQFTVSSNHPTADMLTFGGSVRGYTSTNCSGPILDDDILTGTMNACTSNYSIITNGLSCADKSYRFVYVVINGTQYTNGQNAVINGHTYHIVINNSTCSPYPC